MSDHSNANIWQLQADVDIQGLIRALESDDAGHRKRAAAALRALASVHPSITDTALTHLRQALAQETDTEAQFALTATIEAFSDEAPTTRMTPPDTLQTIETPRPALLETLTNAPDEQATQMTTEKPLVERLLDQLKSNDAQAIIAAARHLGNMGDPIATEPLILLFKDATLSIQVRLAVAEALLKLKAAPVEVALLANLRHHDWHIRRNGAAILGQLQADWAIEPLANALRDQHPVVRRTARAALKHIGTPESRKVLARYSPGTKSQPKDEQTTTPGGYQVKRVSDVRKPKSQMLKRLDDEQADAADMTIPSVNKMDTQRLNEDSDDSSAPDNTPHNRSTRPLDPQTLERYAQMRKNKAQNKASQTNKDTNDDS